MADLLDTNVLSELPKPRPNPNVLSYLSGRALSSLFISTVAIAENRYGILMAAEDRRPSLETKLASEVRTSFDGRILYLTESILVRWRVLLEQGRRLDRTYSQPDLLIAATALEHDLTLVTRNVRDFEDIEGLRLLNPWTYPE